MRISHTLTSYDPTKIGALVRYMRVFAGLSRKQLADELDLDPSSVTRIEQGTRHRISLEDLFKVARVCNFELRLSIKQK